MSLNTEGLSTYEKRMFLLASRNKPSFIERKNIKNTKSRSTATPTLKNLQDLNSRAKKVEPGVMIIPSVNSFLETHIINAAIEFDAHAQAFIGDSLMGSHRFNRLVKHLLRSNTSILKVNERVFNRNKTS